MKFSYYLLPDETRHEYEGTIEGIHPYDMAALCQDQSVQQVLNIHTIQREIVIVNGQAYLQSPDEPVRTEYGKSLQ